MGERTEWWTNCPRCERGFTITSIPESPPVTDPDGADYTMDCPFDGASLRGWNESGIEPPAPVVAPVPAEED